MNLADLQRRIHENAVAHGWWPSDRSWPEIRILIVSEIAEALEEFRAGRMETGLWLEADQYDSERLWNAGWPAPGVKPEGFPVECADAAIRIMDYCGRQGWDLTIGKRFIAETIPEQLDGVVEELYAYDEDSAFGACEDAISHLFAIAEANGFDLLATIELKHAYNVGRPFRHGGKAA